jgi:Uma2 family endonuclease
MYIQTGKPQEIKPTRNNCIFEKMKTVIPIPRYTYSDYERWEGDWELIGGYPYAMSPSPMNKHQLLGKNFLYEVEFQLRKLRKDGCICSVIYEIDWIISEETIVRPDIAITCGKTERNDFIRIPPVLIVEVFSTSTRLKDRNVKFKLYEECGVKYYIMADPDVKKLEVFELTDNRYKEKTDNLEFQLTDTCVITLSMETLFTDI